MTVRFLCPLPWSLEGGIGFPPPSLRGGRAKDDECDNRWNAYGTRWRLANRMVVCDCKVAFQRGKRIFGPQSYKLEDNSYLTRSISRAIWTGLWTCWTFSSVQVRFFSNLRQSWRPIFSAHNFALLSFSLLSPTIDLASYNTSCRIRTCTIKLFELIDKYFWVD